MRALLWSGCVFLHVAVVLSATTEIRMADLEARFQKAVYYVRNSPANPEASNDEKLKVYALFKQATVGDVEGAQPWAVQFEARAKWDAWNELKGLDKEAAKERYIEGVAAGNADWESHECMSGYGQ